MSTSDDVAQLERELQDLRDQLASTRHDVEAVKSRQERAASRSSGRSGRSGRRRTVFPEHDEVTGEPVENGLQWAVRPFMLRHRRKWQRARLRLRRKLVWLVVWLVGTGVAATVWGPGAPWAPDIPGACKSSFSTASWLPPLPPYPGVAPAKPGEKPRLGQPPAPAGPPREPLLVRTARFNAWLLRKFTGPPPDPKATHAAAESAGRALVVGALTFRASVQGKPDPAYVRQQNAVYAQRKAAEDAQNVAACTPACPPGLQPRTTGFAGFRPDGADPEAERVTRAAAVAAGARGEQLEIAMRLAWAESQFKATAANPRSSARGVWQIMLTAHQDDPDIRNWADPYASARMMRRISHNFTDWSPWSTWPKVQRDLTAAGGTQAQPVAAADPAASACSPARAPSSYSTGAGMAWGPKDGPAYRNGEIPLSALAHPRSAPRALLRPDAAAALDRLSAAYQARFGRPLGVTDSYRDIAGQRSVAARKPGLAAVPGTSNHGWARALDVVVGGYGSTDYLWLRANAPRFGWDNPGWARPGGSSKHEPWHWEFTPTGASA